jgi:hypothetical protein
VTAAPNLELGQEQPRPAASSLAKKGRSPTIGPVDEEPVEAIDNI